MARITVKPTDTMTTIQNALNKYDVITFQKGTYKITKTLSIPSNRTIYMDGAVLRRHCSKPVFMTAANEKTTGYFGAYNIKVIGGTIEGMNGSSYKYTSSNMFLLFHSSNVTISNVTFLDITGSHAIDIGGCKDTNIIGCKFLGYCTNNKDFRESIQIDYAYEEGIPYFKEGSACYDDTHCEGVNIIGCEFDKSPTYKSQYIAIGTHAQTSTANYHKNINIKYNKANGNGISPKSHGFFVRLVNMRNVNIIGNVVNNYGRFVLIDSTPSTSAKNKGCRDVLIDSNVILDSNDKFKASSIYVNATTTNKAVNITISNNVFDKDGATSFKNCTNLIQKNNVAK